VEVNPNDGEVSKGPRSHDRRRPDPGAHNGLYGTPLPRLIRVRTADLSTANFASSATPPTWHGVEHGLQRAIAQSHGNQALNAYFDGQVDHGVPCPAPSSSPGSSP
jgi:hypothetical protein